MSNGEDVVEQNVDKRDLNSFPSRRFSDRGLKVFELQPEDLDRKDFLRWLGGMGLEIKNSLEDGRSFNKWRCYFFSPDLREQNWNL